MRKKMLLVKLEITSELEPQELRDQVMRETWEGVKNLGCQSITVYDTGNAESMLDIFGDALQWVDVSLRRGLVLALQGSFEKRIINETMIRCNCNKSQVARELGISRTTLDKKLKEHGLA